MLVNLDRETEHLDSHGEILQFFELGVVKGQAAWSTFVMDSYFHTTLRMSFMKATLMKL